MTSKRVDREPTKAMIDAGEDELARQHIALDELSLGIRLGPVFERMHDAAPDQTATITVGMATIVRLALGNAVELVAELERQLGDSDV